jgi:hypothetical protein
MIYVLIHIFAIDDIAIDFNIDDIDISDLIHIFAMIYVLDLIMLLIWKLPNSLTTPPLPRCWLSGLICLKLLQPGRITTSCARVFLMLLLGVKQELWWGELSSLRRRHHGDSTIDQYVFEWR